MLPSADAAIIAASLQTILTGVHFTTFLLCSRWQIYSDNGWSIRKNIQWPMLIITFLTMAFDLGGAVQTVQNDLLAVPNENDSSSEERKVLMQELEGGIVRCEGITHGI
ncbi:hypothetical protein F5887DRAFT_1207369 [Amanita rubescens]|nr:hypothetical protein F5887DRAFT_1207369 [Amanita rubescens]